MPDSNKRTLATGSCVAMGAALSLLVSVSSAVRSAEETAAYSPFAGDTTPREVLFGDTHLHSSWSTDAGMGGATLGPREAYRAARGEQVTSHSGLAFQLVRPLDFVVLADHAENLGLADFIRRSDPILMANPQGRKWHDMVKSGNGTQAFLEWLRADNNDLISEPRMAATAWLQSTALADEYYQPGLFTTLHGFEWTPHPGGNNLHRVVVFRDGKERTRQIVPFTQFESIDPEDLWAYLTEYETTTGGRVLAIPHNSNLSNGLMFATERMGSEKNFDADYALTRRRFEPLVEVTQMKGTSETHPLLSPDDAFADFEILDIANLSGKAAKTPEMLPGEYARAALRTGLALEDSLGVNPFQFGMIGSTDAHTGLPSAREDNNFGKAHIAEPSADRVNHTLIQAPNPELSMLIKDLGASGLAAVWARDNTREAIWDAMARRETYATTGSRIHLRLFAGWQFAAEDLHRPDLARYGYDRGVPMGGMLRGGGGATAPGFLVQAQRDPEGANLDRIQIVKGWLDADGASHERIYDVAVSDGRRINAEGVADEPVGSTVNTATAEYRNSIGDPRLAAFWTDPDFDPDQRAFYYVRVIEIPIPRWSTHDAVTLGAQLPEGTPLTIQDRAYSSPVWYSPES